MEHCCLKKIALKKIILFNYSLTIFLLGVGIYYARVGNIKRHKETMIALYFFALIVAGFFTLMPGRVMHQILISY